jgi:hypothetical protein
MAYSMPFTDNGLKKGEASYFYRTSNGMRLSI